MADSATAGQDVNQAIQQRDERGQLLSTCLLALLPVLAWLVLAIYAWAASPPPASTGDPLLDKLDHALTAQLFYSYSRGFIDAGLPDKEIAAWEPVFGNDPRYWILRFHLTSEQLPLFRVENGELLMGSNEEKRSTWGISREFIREARRRGITDGPVLLRLLSQFESDWRDEAEAAVKMEPPKSKNDPTAYLAATRAVMDERHGVEHQALLDELLAAAPDQALPRYCAAFCEAERGNYDEAIAYLAAGNRARHCSAMNGFPFDELSAATRSGGKLSSEIADEALWVAYLAMPLPNYQQYKRAFQALTAQAIKAQDLAALDELHTYACRYGAADNASVHQAITALAFIILLENAVKADWPGALTSEQLSALNEVGNRRLIVQQNIRAGLPPGGQWIYPLPSGQFLIQSAQSAFCGSATVALWYLDNFYLDAQCEQAMLAGTAKQGFEDLARFDYTTLSWEE